MTRHEIETHNREVAELWDAYSRGENARVPITIATDEFRWLKLTGNSFREFYTDPAVQLRVQLEGDAWMRDEILQDRALGPPDVWTVVPRFWMDEPECFGCEVVIQENDFAWSLPLDVPKTELLARLRSIDIEEMVTKSRLYRLYRDMQDLAAGMQYRGRPVDIYFPGGGTHGIFTIAGRVRGNEALCLDMMEDPDFAFEFIGLITDLTLERIRVWHRLADTGQQFPSPSGWGTADDALELISEASFRQFVLPHYQRMFDALTTGGRRIHLCGRATQHFRSLYDDLGMTHLDGPGTFVDHGQLLAEMPKLSISAQCDHTRLDRGPAEDIDAMMRGMLTKSARVPGRFYVMGFLFRDTPVENARAFYEAGRRHGGIG